MSTYGIAVIRSILAFAVLFLLTRLHGKEQLSQLSFFEYVYGIGAGTIAGSVAIAPEKVPWIPLIALITWGVVASLLQVLTQRSRAAARVLASEPTIVISNGKIQEDAMNKVQLRYETLMAQLRQKDAFNVADVEFAVVETDGKVSVLKKSQYQALTPADLKLETVYKGLSTELVVEGKVIEANLDRVKLMAAARDFRGINDDTAARGEVDQRSAG
jgi:uncharacterized membrane protein YcaP (DUF421 family)